MNNEKDDISEVDSKSGLTGWKKEPTVADLKEDLTNALSDHTLAENTITSWLNLLHVDGNEKIQVKKGRSKVQPKLIRKHAEWRYATLGEPFLSTQDLFKVDPVTGEDLESARQNQIVLNNQFNTKINKVKLINDYVRTAVNEGTVIFHTGWKYEEVKETKEETIYEYVVDTSTDAITNLERMGMIAEKLGEKELEKYFDPHFIQAFQLTIQTGVPHWFVENGTETIETTRVVRNHPEIEICDYRNVIIDPLCKGDLNKAQFIIMSFETSLSELKKDGDKYTNLDKINLQQASVLAASDMYNSESSSFNYADKARKRLLAYEYWGYWDIDGTGITKPIVATFVDNVMIRLDESPFPDGQLPFVLVQYLPTKGVYGEADAELLADNQRITGAVTRGMIDLLGRSANAQQGTRKDALDIANRRKFDDGDDYEFNPGIGNPETAFHMHKYPEIPQSASFMIQMQQNEAESMIGNKAFSSGISGQSLGNTATGARGALDAAARRDIDILNRLASGLIEVGRKVVAMNKLFLSDQEIVRVTNDEFMLINREDLEGHFDLRMTVSTAAMDNERAQELGFMLQTIGPEMDWEMRQLMLAEIADLRKMPTLADKIRAYQPQPDPMAQMKAELEIKLLEAQIAETLANAQNKGANAMLNESKVGTETVKQGNIQSQTDKNTLDFVEQETGTKQERDLQKQGAQAEANMRLELLKKALETESKTQA